MPKSLRPPAALAALALALSSVLLASPARAATVTITIGASVQPASITIAPGTTVTFTNADGDRHRVRTTSGPAEFDSGNLEPGQSFSVTLTAVGTYAYRDERNTGLTAYWGTIVVSLEPTPAPTTAGSLPPGVTPAPPAATPSSGTVRMAGRAFRPATVSITAGGSVTFVNDDDRAHTVTSTTRAFDSGTMAAGSSYTRTFPAAGTFGYLCLLHPDMTGTVVVSGTNGATAPPAPPAPTAVVATPAPTLPPGATQPPPTSAAASIVDFDFSPAVLRVTEGSTITWRNAGVAPHTVTAVDGSFDSGTLQAGGVFTRRFAAAGTFRFLCVVHPQMTGTVVVSTRDGGGAPPGSSAAPDAVPGPSGPPGASVTSPPLSVVVGGAPSGTSAPDAAAPGSNPGPSAAPAPMSGALLALLVALLVAAAITLFAVVLVELPGMSPRGG